MVHIAPSKLNKEADLLEPKFMVKPSTY